MGLVRNLSSEQDKGMILRSTRSHQLLTQYIGTFQIARRRYCSVISPCFYEYSSLESLVSCNVFLNCRILVG